MLPDQLPFSIPSGCDTIFLLEGSVEIGQVKETAAFCDGQDAVIGCDKKPCCDISPEVTQIGGKGYTHSILKKSHKMGFRESTVRSNVRNGYCFFVVSIDIR